MRKDNQKARGAASRVIRLQFERERQLLELHAQLEQRSESARRDYEWKIMFTEKGFLAGIVGLALLIASIYGNVLVERYKGDAAIRQAKTLAIRTASNKVWGKFVLFEEGVDRLGETVRTQHLHQGIDMFKSEIAKDQKNVDDASSDTKQTFSELWETLHAEELNLGPGVHSVFFRAMQDVAVVRSIDEFEGLHRDKQDTIETDAIEEARNDLEKQKQVLSSVMDRL